MVQLWRGEGWLVLSCSYIVNWQETDSSSPLHTLGYSLLLPLLAVKFTPPHPTYSIYCQRCPGRYDTDSTESPFFEKLEFMVQSLQIHKSQKNSFLYMNLMGWMDEINWRSKILAKQDQTATTSPGLGICSSVFRANRSFFVSERARVWFARFILSESQFFALF